MLVLMGMLKIVSSSLTSGLLQASSCCILPHGSCDGKAHVTFYHTLMEMRNYASLFSPCFAFIFLLVVEALGKNNYLGRSALRRKHLRFPSDNGWLQEKLAPNQTMVSMLLRSGQKETSVLPCGVEVSRLRWED